MKEHHRLRLLKILFLFALAILIAQNSEQVSFRRCSDDARKVCTERVGWNHDPQH